MARQFLAAPACSAEPERVFSTAGRAYGPERKRLKAENLEHLLKAGCNVD
jgi:hypothetical protein